MTTVNQLLQTKGREIWSVSPQASVLEALQTMAEKNIGALLVMEGERLVGIFSERDYARNAILRGQSCIASTIGQLMTRDVYYVSPDTPLEECMALMTRKHIRHLPVLEESRVTGVVTLGDVVTRIMSHQASTIRELERMVRNGRLE